MARANPFRRIRASKDVWRSGGSWLLALCHWPGCSQHVCSRRLWIRAAGVASPCAARPIRATAAEASPEALARLPAVDVVGMIAWLCGAASSWL